jgi:PQQ-dependent dehydrogenase (methanol/ethanol family)
MCGAILVVLVSLASITPASFGHEAGSSGADVAWPTYGLDYLNTRHTNLAQINAANVALLVPAWRYLTGVHGRMETTPLVVGQTMYVTTGADNGVEALDAASGALRWKFTPKLGVMELCCGHINRGVAIDGERLFYATLDARLIALDANTGKLLWQRPIGDPREGLSETMAPLAWQGIVIIGSSGGELGIRGSVSAYRARDGQLLWRWYSVSPNWEGRYVTSVHGVSLHRNIAQEKANAAKHHDAWRHGGGPVWMTPALDEATHTIYVSTGNPSPDYRPDLRPGDNLYTDSIVALDALTGAMRWFYQQTPHDPGDHDAASPPVLFDARSSWRTVRAVGEAGKTGWVYILDRANGHVIRISENFVPQEDVYMHVPLTGAVVRPGTLGGAIAPMSVNPSLHLAFVEATDLPQWIDPAQGDLAANDYQGGTVGQSQRGDNFVIAIDVDTGRIVWRHELTSGHNWMLGGTLSAGDLVFASDPFGALEALEARTGKPLWQYQIGANDGDTVASWSEKFHDLLAAIKRAVLGEPAPVSAYITAPPIAYEVRGREYVAVAADVTPGRSSGGMAIFSFALPKE